MDGDNGNDSMELQLRGGHLAAGVVALLALCTAVFFLGRWYERTRGGGSYDPDIEEVPEILSEEDVDRAPLSSEEVEEQLTFYDNLSGKPDASPKRQPAAEPAAPSREGDIVIQVLATQDESAARSLEKRLKGGGYAVYVESGRDGTDRLIYRVRVGPYTDRAEADRIAGRLQEQEKLSTWVRAAE